eukprot:8977132-Pyramimonas_sp.AAC.1
MTARPADRASKSVLGRCRSVGRPSRIFSVVVVLLAAHREYSQTMSFNWLSAGGAAKATRGRGAVP